jgi:CRP/FNR family transcriptional regulator, cyclic AMP receptor protein
MSAVAELLAATGLYDALSPEALASCARDFVEQRFKAGATVFSRGDPGEQMFVVADGRVRLSVMSEDGRELSVRHAGPGALLGEIAVMDGGPRTADAIAMTDLRLHGVSRARLLAQAEAHPSVARGMIGLLCKRLRETTDQLEGIALHPIDVRLARFLLVALGDRKPEPGKRIPLDLAISQTEMAQLLGASRSKVNVALGALEKTGALKRTSDRLFLDPALLRDVAGTADG